MIVSAHLLPHTPLLLPSIGKERTEALALTQKALNKALDDIRRARPDTIVVISSHGTVYKESYSANLRDIYRGHFEEFGDFTTAFTAKSDLETIDRLKRHLRLAGVPFKQSSDDSLDYGTAITLSSLTSLLQKTRIIPFSPSMLDAKSHFEAGLHASEVLLASNKRFSIICSGDLSQRLTSTSPGGYAKEGALFDQKVQELLTSHNILGFLKLDPNLVTEVGECVYRPLLLTLGMIEAFPHTAEILSYEAPFGVGEIVVSFKLG